jgi:dTDP-glucose 4,6-dehydratase
MTPIPETHVLVTGGAGFIGSHLVDALLARPTTRVTVLDKLTYAGARENLAVHDEDPRFAFVHGDVAESPVVSPLVAAADHVIHAAAETHVDRSIEGAAPFIATNVTGTHVLLDACRRTATAMLMVSTDEVYGENAAGAPGFVEDDPMRPRSPYAASKAAAELLCGAWFATYGTAVTVVRGTNAFGPRQFPEKAIAVYTLAALEGRELPVYGRGEQRREWLFVTDWVAGCLAAMERGAPGAAYNIGAGRELPNLELARRICGLTGADDALVTFVADRAGHDFRYGIDASKLEALGWSPRRSFEDALEETVGWYRDHRDWVRARLAGAGTAG